jgi:hypothetical protein
VQALARAEYVTIGIDFLKLLIACKAHVLQPLCTLESSVPPAIIWIKGITKIA